MIYFHIDDVSVPTDYLPSQIHQTASPPLSQQCEISKVSPLPLVHYLLSEVGVTFCHRYLLTEIGVTVCSIYKWKVIAETHCRQGDDYSCGMYIMQVS